MEEAQMSDYIIFRFILDYALVLFGIWAIATVIADAMFTAARRGKGRK
jgi:hypothetical protein